MRWLPGDVVSRNFPTHSECITGATEDPDSYPDIWQATRVHGRLPVMTWWTMIGPLTVTVG